MASSKPLACVIGDMDLVRPLALAGIRSAVVAPRGEPAGFSRAAAARVEWTDPWIEPEVLAERLVAFARRQPHVPVLFYQEDRDLLMVSRLRDRLASAFAFVVADPALVEDLVDKRRFQELAQRLGLPVPPAQLIPAGVEARPELDLRFPLVLKPLTRHRFDQWQLVASGKAMRVDSHGDLDRVWPELARTGLDVLAQELVEGPEARIESYHVYVDAAGEIAGEFTGAKIRTWPRSFGFSTAVRITDDRELAELGRRLSAVLALKGVAKLDFKRAPDGRLYLLEVNPRFSLWHHPGAKAGVNLPALVYADLVGLRRPAPTRARSGVAWCHHLYDARAARENGVSLVSWARWAARCDAVSTFAWDDPLPFVRGVVVKNARRRLRPT